VETRDANPFRFAGEVVTPSARSWPRYEDALERHPTTESCLIEAARCGQSLDLLAYDWMGIDGRYAHDVCLFRVWTALGAPDVIASWMSELASPFGRVNTHRTVLAWTGLEGSFPGTGIGRKQPLGRRLGGRGVQRFLDNIFFEPTLVLTATFLPGGDLDYSAVSYIRE